jgi:hypothetical protein
MKRRRGLAETRGAGMAVTALLTLLIGVLGCASAPAPCPAAPVAAACSPATPSASDSSLAQLTNEQVVRKLLELTGAGRLGKQVADGMVENLRKMPDLPAGFLDRFQQNIHTEELIDLMVPIYLKHYDRETLLAAIAFYESNHGQALIHELPSVTAESMEVGRAWGRDLAQKTMHELGVTPPAKKP